MATPKTERTLKKRTSSTPGRTNPDAAGIDLGATVHYVAVPADRDEKPVQHSGTLTEDLIALADWLKQCRITTVAMESRPLARGRDRLPQGSPERVRPPGGGGSINPPGSIGSRCSRSSRSAASRSAWSMPATSRTCRDARATCKIGPLAPARLGLRPGLSASLPRGFPRRRCC